jgi:hypothetical protein
MFEFESRLPPRHCEERLRRSNPAFFLPWRFKKAGLLRFARNDVDESQNAISPVARMEPLRNPGPPPHPIPDYANGSRLTRRPLAPSRRLTVGWVNQNPPASSRTSERKRTPIRDRYAAASR